MCYIIVLAVCNFTLTTFSFIDKKYGWADTEFLSDTRFGYPGPNV